MHLVGFTLEMEPNNLHNPLAYLSSVNVKCGLCGQMASFQLRQLRSARQCAIFKPKHHTKSQNTCHVQF